MSRKEKKTLTASTPQEVPSGPHGRQNYDMAHGPPKERKKPTNNKHTVLPTLFTSSKACRAWRPPTRPHVRYRYQGNTELYETTHVGYRYSGYKKATRGKRPAATWINILLLLRAQITALDGKAARGEMQPYLGFCDAALNVKTCLVFDFASALSSLVQHLTIRALLISVAGVLNIYRLLPCMSFLINFSKTKRKDTKEKNYK